MLIGVLFFNAIELKYMHLTKLGNTPNIIQYIWEMM